MRARGEGTIRKRPNGTWEARVDMGYDDNGNRIRKSVYGKTQAEVRRKKAELLSAKNANVSNWSTMTVAEWTDKWLNDYTPNIKPNTRHTYTTAVRSRIVPAIGDIRLCDLNSVNVQDMFTNINLAPGTVHLIHMVLQLSLERALVMKMIPYNPARGCVLPKLSKRELIVMDDAEVKMFVDEFRKSKLFPVFMLYLLTGMRHNELDSITWDCVDFDKKRIYIYRQIDRITTSRTQQITFSTLKSGKPRYIYPAELAFEILATVREDQEKILAKTQLKNPYGFVFIHRNGKRVTYKNIDREFMVIRKRIGRENVRIHDLRHAFATIALRNGDDMKTVSAMLGHASVAFTMDVYGHVTQEMYRNAGDRMQKYMVEIGAIHDSTGESAP